MNKVPVKVGVVGCGFIAQSTHIPSLLKCKNARLVALCDRNGELTESIARKFGIDRHYADLAEMLSREKLDVVDVCTSINTHASLAIQAMEAGCHVLTEKPMALSIDEADEMISVSKRNHVKLGVVHDMLFMLAMMRIKSMVKSGVPGKLVRVEVKQSAPPWDFPIIADPGHWWHKLPGGVFSDMLPHPLYLAREFLGDVEPVAVHSSKIGNLKHMRFDEVEIILEGRNGVGTIISSCNWPSLMMIDIFGTKLNIHGNLYNGVVIKYGGKSNMGKGSPPRRALENLNRSAQILTSTVSTGMSVILGKRGGHRSLISKVIESIQNDTELPVTAEDGRENVRLLEKITSQMQG